MIKNEPNTLLARTQNIITKMTEFAKDVELQWGVEEKTRAVSALRSIDVLIRNNGMTWGEVLADTDRRNNITSIVQQVVFLKLNPDAIPREVYFITRNVRVGEDEKGKAIYKKFIESGIEGAGNDAILRNFGDKVKNVKSYIVYEGDHFTGVSYEGFDVKLPSYKPKMLSVGESKGKAVYAVYLIEKTDKTFDVSISEREDVKQSLLAHIRQNGADEEYILSISNYSLDDILDGKVPNKEFKKENKRWDKIQRKWILKVENLTLEDLISPAWRSAISREKMIERKMRNHATRRYPKNFSHNSLQELYEDTFEDEKHQRQVNTTPTLIVDVENNQIAFDEQSGSIELDEFVEVDLEVEDEFVDESYFSDDDVAFEVETDEGLVFAPEFESVENAKLAEKQQKESEQDDFNETVPNWMSLD